MSELDLDAIRAAEVRAGLDWNLDNAHPLLMAVGPLIDEVRRLRMAAGDGLEGATNALTVQMLRLHR